MIHKKTAAKHARTHARTHAQISPWDSWPLSEVCCWPERSACPYPTVAQALQRDIDGHLKWSLHWVLNGISPNLSVALVTKYLGKIWYTVERQGATNGAHFRLDFARAWVFNKMENNSVNRNDDFTAQNAITTKRSNTAIFDSRLVVRTLEILRTSWD